MQGVVFINQQRTLEMERFLHLRQDLERVSASCKHENVSSDGIYLFSVKQFLNT